MTSQYVDLDLRESGRDKARRFRFTPFDARTVCRVLNNLAGYAQPNAPVNADRLRLILIGRDFEAYALVLSVGLKHEDPRMDDTKAMKLLSDYLSDGGSLESIAVAIRDAALASGVWEPDPQMAAATDGSSRDS